MQVLSNDTTQHRKYSMTAGQLICTRSQQMTVKKKKLKQKSQ